MSYGHYGNGFHSLSCQPAQVGFLLRMQLACRVGRAIRLRKPEGIHDNVCGHFIALDHLPFRDVTVEENELHEVAATSQSVIVAVVVGKR